MTWIVGKSTRGSGATGSSVKASDAREEDREREKSAVAMGRRTNGAERFRPTRPAPFPLDCCAPRRRALDLLVRLSAGRARAVPM